jgi:hypothetical protein
MMGQTILVQTRAFGGLRNYAIPVKYPLGWRESYSRVLIRGAELTTGTPDAELWEARLADLKTACP